MSRILMILSLALAVPTGAYASGTGEDLSPLKVATIRGKSVLVNPAGMTVYTYDPDGVNQSHCTGHCASAWPPVTVNAEAVVHSPLARVTRADGSIQLSYDGHPLYLYVDDRSVGDTTGDGLGGVWHLVSPD